MRLIGVVAFASAALVGYAPPASAACDVTVTLRNDGATPHTFFKHWARTRMRRGTWVHLWRGSEPLVLQPGQSTSLTYRATECGLDQVRAFEFHIDPAACGTSGPGDAWWLTGGGHELSLRKLLKRDLPRTGETIKILLGFAKNSAWVNTPVPGVPHDAGSLLLVDLGNLGRWCPPYAPRERPG